MHDAASEGFGRHPQAYQRARPAYHPDLVARFVSHYGRGVVVDLGAGTGIFTRQIAEGGTSVVAVEPVKGMRATLAKTAPGVHVIAATAEDTTLNAGSVDTVVAAQAFHWFDHGRALTEIHRVLRPGGFLVTVWNVRDDAVAWVRAYDDVLRGYEGEAPRHAGGVWRHAIDADARFDPVDDWAVANPTPASAEDVVQRALTTSFIAALPVAKRHEVAESIRDVVRQHVPITEFPYRSELQAWRSN